MWIRLAGVLVAVLAASCAAEIGDECETSVDCSPEGDRICDTAQWGGYCTVEDCEPDRCPDDALCVLFGDELRFQRRYCMAVCESGSDCRGGYACVAPGDNESTIVDEDRSGRYCVEH